MARPWPCLKAAGSALAMDSLPGGGIATAGQQTLDNSKACATLQLPRSCNVPSPSRKHGGSADAETKRFLINRTVDRDCDHPDYCGDRDTELDAFPPGGE